MKTEAEKKAIVDQIDALRRDKGMNQKEAAKAAGVNWTSYYTYRNDLNAKPKARAKRQVKKPEVLTFEVPAQRDVPMMLIWGMPKDIFAALDKVAR